jgi:uncharacterized alpha-E superfamily protein
MQYGHSAKRASSTRLRRLHATLAEDSAAELIARGMHEELDAIQLQLAGIVDALGREFFLHGEQGETVPTGEASA